MWEPARFGWAFTLGRAYHLSGDEKYAAAFWQFFETFTDANPPCLGPHWMSGQEVALRLMAFVWAAQVFAASPSSTPERKSRLAASVAAHAARIPPTLVYARSQQNNHLLSEAAGLLTAGLALPDHPGAASWRRPGLALAQPRSPVADRRLRGICPALHQLPAPDAPTGAVGGPAVQERSRAILPLAAPEPDRGAPLGPLAAGTAGLRIGADPEPGRQRRGLHLSPDGAPV